MAIFFRIDSDPNPDTQSFYDNAGIAYGKKLKSKFFSKQYAIESFLNIIQNEYKQRDWVWDESIPQWLEDNVVQTAPRQWGLPTPPNTLFGVGADASPDEITEQLYEYSKAGRYLQVWEGTWVNDNSPIRKVRPWDGELFIPQRLLQQWQITPQAMKFLGTDSFYEWAKAKVWDYPPWEYPKTAALKKTLTNYYQGLNANS